MIGGVTRRVHDRQLFVTSGDALPVSERLDGDRVAPVHVGPGMLRNVSAGPLGMDGGRARHVVGVSVGDDEHVERGPARRVESLPQRLAVRRLA